jgi:Flp pilus assembly protein TadD
MVLALLAAAGPANADFLRHHPKPPTAVTDKGVAEIQSAIDEQRYVDAAQALDQAAMAGLKDPRLTLLTGVLNLARGQATVALGQFRLVDADSTTRARALEGEGVALSELGRSEEALLTLQKAVTEDPSAWRAWNALGSEYDQRHDWTGAETAYDHALTDSGGAAIVLNNRGYSRLLQNRLDEAVLDFVEALKKKPDLAAARTNLRMAMAMRGQYDRAVSGGGGADQAMLLNNAGFAAIVRGDYARAQDLLTQAMKVKGEYYGRASANLDLAREMASRGPPTGDATPHADH